MNIQIDKIAEQWSHRVGIIDKNDPLHIIELKKILNEHKLEESVIDQYVSNLVEAKKVEKETTKKIPAIKMSFVKKHNWLIEDIAFKLYDALKTKSKRKNFEDFINTLPSGDPTKKTKAAINTFSDFSFFNNS